MRKKTAEKNDRVFIFRIILDASSPYYQLQGLPRQKAPWCEIAILGSQTLYNFAEAIVRSFDFDFDHCFGFFDNLEDMYGSKRKYELFTDLPDVESTLGARGVQKEKISQVFTKENERMLFFFDYGDSWRFIVNLQEIKKPDLKKHYPELLATFGQTLEQYPPLKE